MSLTIIAFGQVAAITGNELSVDFVADTDALKLMMEKKFPSLQRVKYAMAVDKQTISGNTPLQTSSVIALLPPFSGG